MNGDIIENPNDNPLRSALYAHIGQREIDQVIIIIISENNNAPPGIDSDRCKFDRQVY